MHLKNKKIAIIGAGMTGISCMKALKTTDAKIDVFEKSRGAGGRMATRRIGKEISADHGAQFFTGRSREFTDMISAWAVNGFVTPWSGNNQKEWFVGTPAMNSPLKSEITPESLHASIHISQIKKCDNTWTLSADDLEYGGYDYVICTVPAPQVPAIIKTAAPELIEPLNTVKIAPCWALMLIFENSINTDLSNWRGHSDIISWIGRNSSKQGRDFPQDSWTVHATPEWSAENLELDAEEAAKVLFVAFSKIIRETTQEPIIKTAHRWRYAKTLNPLGAPFMTNVDKTLYLGGDWCLGARVENAFESGRLIAQNLIENSYQ